MLKLSFIDQARMVGDMPACHRLAPVWLVELADARDWHQVGFEVPGQCDQAINVPRPQSRSAGPEVILLAHALPSREV